VANPAPEQIPTYDAVTGAVISVRNATDEERAARNPTEARLADATAAIDQLIIDMLMGGM
jgi:hypothetical protein